MADTGFKFPGTMVGNRPITGSDADWVNPDNAKADDGSITRVSLNGTGTSSSGLAATNFDFSSIPNGAIIDGIEIRVGDYEADSVASQPQWAVVKLILDDDSDGTEDRKNDLSQWTASLQTDEAGGIGRRWGESGITVAQVKDVDWGFFIGVRQNGAGPNFDDIDFVQMKVHYHENLPVPFLGVPGTAGHHSPFKSSAGNFYAIALGVLDVLDKKLEVFRATDSTGAWIVQDESNAPEWNTSFPAVISAIQAGDVIHIATDVGGVKYEYHSFDMSSNTWGVVEETIETPTNAPTLAWISIAVRSDGDVVVVYAGDTDQVMGGKKERVDANVRTGGTWGGPIALDAAGDIHYGNPNCVLGASDWIHCLWQLTTATADPPTAWQATRGRSIDPSDDSLSTVDNSTHDTSSLLLGQPHLVSYNDGGTQKISLNDASDGGALLKTLACVETSNIIVLPPGDGDTEGMGVAIWTPGNLVILSVAELGTDLHVLFAGGGSLGSDQDLYYGTSSDDGASWTTAIEEIDAATINFISANIYAKGAAADTGWKFPGTMVGNRFIVSSFIDWANEDNAKADDGSNATESSTGDEVTSGLAASNFDFSAILDGSLIEGIEIRVGDYANTGTAPTWAVVKLILADNSDGPESKHSVMSAWTGSLQTDEAGGATDVWGRPLTAADVKDVDFGFFIGLANSVSGIVASVDFMQMKVHYRRPPVVLAYVYDDGGVQNYNEKILVAAPDFLPFYPKRSSVLLRM